MIRGIFFEVAICKREWKWNFFVLLDFPCFVASTNINISSLYIIKKIIFWHPYWGTQEKKFILNIVNHKGILSRSFIFQQISSKVGNMKNMKKRKRKKMIKINSIPFTVRPLWENYLSLWLPLLICLAAPFLCLR